MKFQLFDDNDLLDNELIDDDDIDYDVDDDFDDDDGPITNLKAVE